MVLNYYNLRRQPFGVVPDPRFLLMTATHREALASLTYGLHEERGFMALVAPPGMGKTTLLFHLLAYLRGRARTAFLFQTQCEPMDFFRYLVRDLGITPGPDLASIHEQLNEVLLNEAREGRKFVLIVDEAQGLPLSVLETIRLLSDFESPDRKLMQIIIAGQMGLIETLVRDDMEQLRQRISIVASLKPLDEEETADYIGYRLKVAGHQGASLFTEEAIQMIARSSEGIPRNINNICFNALSIGFALETKRIGREVINEVLTDRRIESLLPQPAIGDSSFVGARAYPNSIAPSATTSFGNRFKAIIDQVRTMSGAEIPRPLPFGVPNPTATSRTDSSGTLVHSLDPILTNADRTIVGPGLPADAGIPDKGAVRTRSIRTEGVL